MRPGDQRAVVAEAVDQATAADLHLDDIVAALCAGADRAWLRPQYLTPLTDADAVAYRLEVFRDLASPGLREACSRFAAGIGAAQAQLTHAARLINRHERNRWLAEAAMTYCTSVADLVAALAMATISSRALGGVREALQTHVALAGHTGLVAETTSVLAGLAAVAYRLDIDENTLTVARDDGADDYGAEILATFARFRQAGAAPLPVDVFRTSDMNVVEVGILERVVRLHPAVFADLDAFPGHHPDPIDPGVAAFANELAFYLAYLEMMDPLVAAGLAFSHPIVGIGPAGMRADGLFDLALACNRGDEAGAVVTNDVAVQPGERRIVVTGANQGGKTTLARALGLLHHLASIGVPVPARAASLQLADRVYTLFERLDDGARTGGRVEADLERARAITDAISPSSLVILNEAFSATTVADALALNRAVLTRIAAKGAMCVVVTFLAELADPDAGTVSLVGRVEPGDGAGRTYRFERRPPDGMARAQTLVERHQLDYASVVQRLAP